MSRVCSLLLKHISTNSQLWMGSTFEEHHNMVFNILWEMVVSSNINMKISAANLLKAIVRLSLDYSIYIYIV